MRALVLHGPEDIRCESVSDPKPADARGAVVRVEGTGICGSDLHLYHGKFPIAEHGFVIGHEVVGEVVETGSAVGDFRSGDRVADFLALTSHPGLSLLHAGAPTPDAGAGDAVAGGDATSQVAAGGGFPWGIIGIVIATAICVVVVE